jgi:GTP-binding protein EngB required for normal cell division
MLSEYNLDFYIIANKIDKLNQSAQSKLVRDMMLHVSDKKYILYSSLNHTGRKELLDNIGL